ncbi:MAG TPA: hypothetical protein VHT92_00710, partial [Candidatus Cybelea sp.]|nr:hypothetical protein [Candidatus Cybelea sp.]
MNARRRATLNRIVATFAPPDARAGRVTELAAAAIDALTPHRRAELQRLLDLLWLPMRAGNAVRASVLGLLANSPVPKLRTGFAALKRLALFLSYAESAAGDNNPTWRRIGYPGPRRDTCGAASALPLAVARAGERVRADVVVVGSGAGGSVVASAFARAGREVVVLEAGGAYAPRDFTQHELAMSELYLDGARTSSDDLGVAVLAGATLGGLLVSLPTVGGPTSEGAAIAATGPSEPQDGLIGGVCHGSLPAGVLRLAQAQTEVPRAEMQAALPAAAFADSDPPLWDGLGTVTYKISTASAPAQTYFDQGLRLAYAFNHGEAQRAFRKAQKLDPECAMCFWGEALVLGPNINLPMPDDAVAPAFAAIEKAQALAAKVSPREQALISALAQRYAGNAKADRGALDAAYASAMAKVVARFPDDNDIAVLYAEAVMDLSPWNYWQPGGSAPNPQSAPIVPTLERVLARDPAHPGAIHYYIHA